MVTIEFIVKLLGIKPLPSINDILIIVNAKFIVKIIGMRSVIIYQQHHYKSTIFFLNYPI